ncbi:hypothetical protein [Fischerella sp. JS2]|uniref:hypothetical protein n=1 Tax=Fischerella sp. JS2 TaxID=2597771 RepID=UPI0028E92E9F|nr:hypothetical protein [Fischerella sp. JS2]
MRSPQNQLNYFPQCCLKASGEFRGAIALILFIDMLLCNPKGVGNSQPTHLVVFLKRSLRRSQQKTPVLSTEVREKSKCDGRYS